MWKEHVEGGGDWYDMGEVCELMVIEVGGGEVGGGGGGAAAPTPSNSSQLRKEQPSCPEFVKQLVSRVADTLNSYFLNRYTLGTWMVTKAIRNPYKKNFPGGPNDTHGFKRELVAYGQQGDVYRHVLFHAGIILSPLPNQISAEANAYDQWQVEEGRKESIAELAGNRAGQAVGNYMLQTFKGDLSLKQLEENLFNTLCARK